MHRFFEPSKPCSRGYDRDLKCTINPHFPLQFSMHSKTFLFYEKGNHTFKTTKLIFIVKGNQHLSYSRNNISWKQHIN